MALLACALLAPPAGAVTFRHGVIGVRLSDRVGEAVAWSPDGLWMAMPARAGKIRLRNVESGEARSLRAPGYRTDPFSPAEPLDWAPDGTIRYLSSPPLPPIAGSDATTLIEVRVDGSGFRQQPLGVRASYIDWPPHGWPLVFAAGPYGFDIEKGPIGPKPSLFVLDQFGGTPRLIQIAHHQGEEDFVEPVVSPDGTRIAYPRWGRNNFRPRNLSIWTIGTDGSGLRRILRGLNYASTVEWSPDGSTIALGAHVSVRSGEQIYVIPADRGRMRRIVDDEILDGPAWSPDGIWLAYSTYDGKIWRIHPDGSSRQLIANYSGREVRNLLWSPDSRHLAYVAAPQPRSD